MTTSRFIKGLIASFVIIFICDYLWHQVLMLDFYSTRFTAINGVPTTLGFPPFIVGFELIASASMAYFLLRSPTGMLSLGEGLVLGALYVGVVVAGINSISHTVILKWDLPLFYADIAWGVVTGALAGMGVALAAGKR